MTVIAEEQQVSLTLCERVQKEGEERVDGARIDRPVRHASERHLCALPMELGLQPILVAKRSREPRLRWQQRQILGAEING